MAVGLRCKRNDLIKICSKVRVWGSPLHQNPAIISDSLNAEIGEKQMRSEINKLTKRKSTKGERKFMELCKKLHIKFRTKVIIQGKEVDFVIGRHIIEIDGHEQSGERNLLLWNEGYLTIHISNWEIDDRLIDWLKIINGNTKGPIHIIRSR